MKLKLEYSPMQQVRLATISAQLQNTDSSLSGVSKDALRKEALQIHKDVETKEMLRVEQKAAAKKARAAQKQARAAAKAAKDAADENFPPPPSLEDCGNDADRFRVQSELRQIALDERAAQKILDSPKYSLMTRDNAARKLRQCAQRRHEIYPGVYGPDGERSTTPASTPTAVELGASKSPECSSNNEQSLTEWLVAEARLQEENPVEYARQLQASREAEEKRRAENLIEWGNRKSTVPTNPDGSYIRSPLQKKVWAEQSREFARRRGEIVDEIMDEIVDAPPLVPDRTTAYRLWDGFLFWSDNVPCESPLPVGTRIHGASTPPHYRAGDNQIPSGLEFDPIAFVWGARAHRIKPSATLGCG